MGCLKFLLLCLFNFYNVNLKSGLRIKYISYINAFGTTYYYSTSQWKHPRAPHFSETYLRQFYPKPDGASLGQDMLGAQSSLTSAWPCLWALNVCCPLYALWERPFPGREQRTARVSDKFQKNLNEIKQTQEKMFLAVSTQAESPTGRTISSFAEKQCQAEALF